MSAATRNSRRRPPAANRTGGSTLGSPPAFGSDSGSTESVSIQQPRDLRLFLSAALGVPLIVYLFTMCRTIYWGDGIELTTAAWVLGVPHPTGYPMFCLLGHALMTLLPLGEPAWRMNTLSALAGAGGAGMMFLFLERLFRWMPWSFRSGRLAGLMALGGAWIFAFSRSQWFHSATTEVYTLHILFTLASFYLFSRLEQGGGVRNLIALTAVTGLALTHHTMAVFLLPLLAVAWGRYWHRWRTSGQHGAARLSTEPGLSRRLFIVAGVGGAVFVLPFLFYLYVPLRAAAQPPVNWGRPSNLSGLLWLMTGGDFRSQYFLHFDPATPFTSSNYPMFFEHRLAGLIEVAGNDFLLAYSPPRAAVLLMFLFLSALAILGLLFLSKVAPWMSLVMATFLAGMIFFIFTYNVTDFGTFYLPLWAAVCPLTVCGGCLLAAQIVVALTRKTLGTPAVLLVLLLGVATLVLNSPVCNKARIGGARDYALDVLDAVEHGAMIITITDNDIYPLWYARYVLGLRPDVTVVGSNFLSSDWYEAFFTPAQLARWRLPIARRGLLTREEFFDLVNNQLIAPNLGRGPIYLTFYDPLLESRFQLEVARDRLIAPDDPAILDSFLPQPFLLRVRGLRR